ncbi:hypothetical protein L1887_15740 [Cichorium endivia]|nr:hypothetical protein L1887_15740 [Cichorium endivia]
MKLYHSRHSGVSVCGLLVILLPAILAPSGYASSPLVLLLVEKGNVNYDYEENEIRISKVEQLKPIEWGSEKMGRVLRQ